MWLSFGLQHSLLCTAYTDLSSASEQGGIYLSNLRHKENCTEQKAFVW